MALLIWTLRKTASTLPNRAFFPELIGQGKKVIARANLFFFESLLESRAKSVRQGTFFRPGAM